MRKRNLIWFLITLNLLSISLISPNVSPHAASGMSLSYDFNDQELSVSITHSVGNPSSHYILSVTIRVNDTIDTADVYTSQPTTMTFIYLYNITAGHGADIQVTAVCNSFGTLIRSIVAVDPDVLPGSFSLSTNAGTPDTNGDFNLIWTTSFGADNYSLYTFTSMITEINLSLTQLADQNALTPFSISGFSNGSYHYLAVAHNKNGDILSNNQLVEVLITPNGGNGEPPTEIPGYNILWILGVTALVMILLIKRKTRN